MSGIEDAPEDLDLVRGEAELSVATAQLRAVEPPTGTAEVAGRVRRVARAAPRRAQLVRAAEPRTHLLVSATVITAVLHERLAPALRDAAVRRVLIDVDAQQHLQSLTVELVVRYGVPIATIAPQAHAIVESTLDDLLGSGRATGPDLGTIHFVDVTTGDPRVVDPADED